MSQTPGTHGSVGLRERVFVRLFDKADGNDLAALKTLAEQMIGNAGDEASNDPDGEENLAVPAGYTYFGQFVDHDLTFDTTSSLTDANDGPTNLRTPRLDLDCVYGSGPDDQPYFYATENEGDMYKGASLQLGEVLAGSPSRRDLVRVGAGPGARAVIGDPRNDENSIVCNIQAAMIQFHNVVVARLAAQDASLRGRPLFVAARKLVRWTYQQIVVDDYLPRVIEPATYNAFRTRLEEKGELAFQMYKNDDRHLRSGMPIEFVGAAYRFGHSMVRTGYKLNASHKAQKIFTPGLGANSLMGFGKLPADHWIEWKRFFPKDNMFPAKHPGPAQNNNKADDRLQWAYRIDAALVDPLKDLPIAIGNGDSLADLNLRRGNIFGLASGQTVAQWLGQAPLADKYLVVRDADSGPYGYKAIPAALNAATPLWYYVLAEAQRGLVDLWLEKNGGEHGPRKLDDGDLLLGLPDDLSLPDPPEGADEEDTRKRSGHAPIAQLGPVGGMILMETFFGLLLADGESYMSIGAQADKTLRDDWFKFFTNNGKTAISMWRLLDVAGLT
ncbi:MAG: peroxidase family protein [Burkholderiales bacterium]